MRETMFGNYIEMVERPELPARTIVAPLSLTREIRMAIPDQSLNLVIGMDEVVYVSSDLSEAFCHWSGQSPVDPLLN